MLINAQELPAIHPEGLIPDNLWDTQRRRPTRVTYRWKISLTILSQKALRLKNIRPTHQLFPASSSLLWRNFESNTKITEMSVVAKPDQQETRADSLSTVWAPVCLCSRRGPALGRGQRLRQRLLTWDHPAPKLSFLGSD